MGKRAVGIVLLTVCLAGGCAPRGQELYRRLQDADPDVRIRAARQAADQGDRGAVPYLVDRLSDTEPDVRFFAFLALRRITGETMGYEYYAPREERAKAIRRWRDWLADRGQTGVADGTATAPSMEDGG